MNEERQIQSMIDFIEREAQEKVEELKQMAQEEYDTEKMRLVEAEKAKVRADFDKKKKNVEIQERVKRANFTKTQRVATMEERATLLEQLKGETKKKIMVLVNDSARYKTLLSGLLLQSLLALQADAVVTARKADADTIKGLIKQAESEYEKKTGKKATITVGKEVLDDNEAWGGVVMKTPDGKITCNNTLAYRSETCFKEQLPTVRYVLFNPEGTI
jgi:V-type H+-transporting ATPase subunit E